MQRVADCLYEIAQFVDSILCILSRQSFSSRVHLAEFLARVSDRIDMLVERVERGGDPCSDCVRLSENLRELELLVRMLDKGESARGVIQVIERARDSLSYISRSSGCTGRAFGGDGSCFIGSVDDEKISYRGELKRLRLSSEKIRKVCGELLGSMIV